MSIDKNSTVSIKRPSKNQGNRCEFVFKNPLTIESVSENIHAIFQSLEKYSAFVITCEERISKIDMGGLQTLMFIDKYCQQNNKTVQFHLIQEEETKKLIHHTGFDGLFANNQ